MPAIPTVCDRHGNFDETSQRRLVTYCIDQGVNGLTPLVIGGEFYKFSEDERRKILRIVIDEANGKVPIIAGVSHSGTRLAAMLAKDAQDAGADAVIVLPPYFEKEEAAISLFKHFDEILGAVQIPLVIQASEEEVQVEISPALVSELAKKHNNLTHIKIEGNRSIAKMEAVQRSLSTRVGIFGGDGGIRMIQEFKTGAIGFIAGAALSGVSVEVFKSLEDDDLAEAERNFRRLKTFLDFSNKYGPAWVQIEKMALQMLGIIDSASVRQPSAVLQRSPVNELRDILKKVGLKAIG